MRVKAQALVLTSSIVAMVIIFLAISINNTEIFIKKEDETLKAAMTYYFYSQSLAYGTKLAFEEYYRIMSFNDEAAIIASEYAETKSEEYLYETYLRAKNLSLMNLDDLRFIEIKVQSNGIRGEGSMFLIHVFNNIRDLANISMKITSAKLISTNESIQIYYRIIIKYKILFFIKNSFKIEDVKIKVNVISGQNKIDLIAQIYEDEIILTVDAKYKNKIVIVLEEKNGIMGWLLA